MKKFNARSLVLLAAVIVTCSNLPAFAEDRVTARVLYLKAITAYNKIPSHPPHPDSAYVEVRKDLEESYSNWENSKTAYFLALVCMKGSDFDAMKSHAQKAKDLKPDLTAKQKSTVDDMLEIVSTPANAGVIGSGAGPSGGTVGKDQYKPLMTFTRPSASLD